MERLTIPDVLVDEHTTRRTMIDVEAVREHAMDFYWRLKAYEDTHMMPSDVTSMRMDMAIIAALFNGVDVDRMKELAEADKDGRVVVLPCQSGEHVFALLDNQTHVWECEVEHAVLDGWRKVFAIRPLGRSKDSYYAPFGAFGQTVFLTREAAEKALEAKRDG